MTTRKRDSLPFLVYGTPQGSKETVQRAKRRGRETKFQAQKELTV